MPEPRVEIEDDDDLFRRIAPDFLLPDGTITSAAFKLRGQPDPNISVDLARLTSPAASLAPVQGRGFRLGVLKAHAPRVLGLRVDHDPQKGNPAHSLILGASTKAHSRGLALAARLLPQEG